MTAPHNYPLSTPLMSLNGIHNYIEMVKVYAIGAERMNDELVRHYLALNLEQLDALVEEIEKDMERDIERCNRYGFKVSHKLKSYQEARYFKTVNRIAKLLTATNAHKL
jgi:hypothetical protein